MKSSVPLVLLLLLTGNCLLAQKAAKSIYGELGGPGLASINYDTRFARREDGLGMRVGIGGFSFSNEESLVLLPMGLNYLVGKDTRNYFEAGAGVTYVRARDAFGDDPFNGTFGHLNVGYRLQPRHGGFTFRAAINPLFGQGVFWPYYGGVSFGYKF